MSSLASLASMGSMSRDPQTEMGGGNAQFPPTTWSLVQDLQGGGARGEAFQSLCQRYWRPIYSYVRRAWRKQNEDAKDATQAFFKRLLDKGGFSLADKNRGRLRTFLLTDLQFFLRDEWVKSKAQKRGGGEEPVRLDSAHAETLLSDSGLHDSAPPDAQFDLEWGVNLIQHAMTRVAKEFEARGKSELFESLKPLATPGKSDEDYDQIREKLGLSTSRMAGAVFRLRKRVRDSIEEAVAETVSTREELKEELHYLRDIFTAS